ncbi:MAG: DUF2238 domain-containing protein [Candidatus Yanofskybacteria bacterium]|nr:DUF2238 domain-containing protein [Candidatus Yanofskybacteria bacterium]
MDASVKKRVIHTTAILTVAAGFILFLGPRSWFPDFYAPRFMGVVSFIFTILLFAPNLIFRVKGIHRHFELKNNAILNLRFAMAICFLLSGAGELGLWQLYSVGLPYDKFVHFIVPLILVIAVSDILYHWGEWPRKRAMAVSMAAVLFASFFWEAIEFYSDRIFGTQLFGVYGTHVSKDTVWDMIFDVLGVVGAWLIMQRKPLK